MSPTSDFNLGTARGTIELDYRGRDAARTAASDLDNVGGAAGRANPTLKKVGTAALVGGAGIVAGFAMAVNSAANFEKGMSGIQAVSGASASEMEVVRKKALQLGADTAFSASEAGTAIEELVKAGISIPDVMNGAADATVALAAAGGVALPEAATIAANAMNQFALSAKDMPNIADKIAGAANASAIDVSDFGMSMKQAGAVAHLAGMSFDDMGIAIAEMGNAGIKGSDAGTSLKSFLSNLIPTSREQTALFEEMGLAAVGDADAMKRLQNMGIKPVSKGYDDVQKAMAKYVAASGHGKVGTADNNKEVVRLGRSTGALTNQFFDAAGNVKNLKDMQILLAEKTKDMTKEQKLATFNVLFGSDAIRAAAILAEAGGKGYEKMAAGINKTKAADVAAVRMKNLAGQTEQMKGSAETLAIQIGMILIPAITSLLGQVTGLFNWFGNLSEGTKKFIVIATLFVAGLLLAVGAAIKIAEAIKAVRLAQIALSTTFLASPIFWIIAAIVALVVALVLLYKNNEAFRNFVDAAWTKIKAVIASVVGWIMNTAVPWLIAAWNAIKVGAQALWAGIVGVWNAIVSGITTAVNAIKTVIMFVFNLIKTVVLAYFNAYKLIITTVFNAIKTVITTVLNAIWLVISTVFNTIKTVITTVLNAILGVWNAVWGVFGPLVKAVWDLIVAIIQLGIRAVSQFIMAVMNTLKGWWDNVWGGISSTVSAVWNAIWGTVSSIFNKVWGFIQTTLNVIIAFFASRWANLKANTIAVWNLIKNALTGPINAAKSLLTTVINAIVSFFSSRWENIRANATAVWNLIKSAVTGPINSARTTVQSVVDMIKNAVSNAFNTARTLATNAFNGLRDAIVNALTTARNKVSSIIDTIKGFFSGAGTWLLDAGKKLIQGLIDGISSMVKKVTGALTGITSKIKSFLPGSPIKEGPLVSWNNGKPGAALVELIASGIAGNIGAIEEAFSGMSVGMPTALSGAGVAVAGSAARTGAARMAVGASVGKGGDTYQIDKVTIPAHDLEEMRGVQDFFNRIQQESRRRAGANA